MTPKRCKTPLRYPGGKSKMLSKILPHFPFMAGVEEFREPFLGGGSMAIEVTKSYPSLKVWVNDLHYPLYCFWLTLQQNTEKLHSTVSAWRQKYDTVDKAKEFFFVCKEALEDHSLTTTELASRFYVTNRCSFSGLSESSGFSKQAANKRWTVSGIDNLLHYQPLIKDWKITNLSYEELLTGGNTKLVYLDPPYDISSSNLYGKRGDKHKGFDHELFASHCITSQTSQLISYNSDPWVTERFPEYNQLSFDHNYSMQSSDTYRENQKDRQELLLTNY